MGLGNMPSRSWPLNICSCTGSANNLWNPAVPQPWLYREVQPIYKSPQISATFTPETDFQSPSLFEITKHHKFHAVRTPVLFIMEKEMATHSSILAWRIPSTEEAGGLQSMGSQRVGQNWVTSLSSFFSFFLMKEDKVFAFQNNNGSSNSGSKHLNGASHL